MNVFEVARVRLRPTDRSGYLRESDLTLDTFAGLTWAEDTPGHARRVVIDLGSVTGFGPGVTDRVARNLVDVHVGVVEVEGSTKPMVRTAFCRGLTEALVEAGEVLS